MNKERKICLPMYKVLYSLCFVAAFCLARGIADITEIGSGLDAVMAMLSIVFCADTYWAEHQGKRWEIFSLYPIKKRAEAIFRRLAIQWGFLFALSVLGYVGFYWQRPANLYGISGVSLFGQFLLAVGISILLWSSLSMTMVNVCRSLWGGMGIVLVLWLVVNSKAGQKFLGKWSVFAYGFRKVYDPGDLSWMAGKAAAVVTAALILAAALAVMKRRG